MGLSRKLGGSSKSEPAGDVEYQWSTQSYTLREIIAKFKLPRVVQCAAESCSILWSQFEFDLKQPLLVFSKRCTRKVCARSLRFDDVSQELLSFGPPVIIPEDYDGWFTVVNSRSDTLPRHTRIETIAGCPSEKFLVTTKLPVLIHAPGPNGEAHYVAGEVSPGEVLTKTGECEGDSAMAEELPSLKKGKPCLRCIDEKNDDIIIPFSHRARMYEISDEVSATSQGLVRINHVIETGEALFPTVVRHMFGEPPAVAYSFTGSLKLENVFEDESVLASTLDKEAPFPLEIKSDSKVKFCIALNEADIKRTNEYMNAFNACEELGEKYLTGMKVAFTLKPEMSPLDPLDWSVSETGSDAEDVDAQSEFVIDWDPDRTSSMMSLVNSEGSKQPGPKPDVVLSDRRAKPRLLPNMPGKGGIISVKKKILPEQFALEELREEIV